MTTSQTTTRQPITASQLLPGDVVLTGTGARWFAAFDVDHSRGGDVRVWTSVADQDLGEPAVRVFSPTTGLDVDRKTGGPQVRHTDLVLCEDGSVEITRY